MNTASSRSTSSSKDNDRLAEVARLEDDLRVVRDKQPPALTDSEHAEILALGSDLERLWNHPAASVATRKRILRAVLEEIIVAVEPGHLRLKLHWKGGDHTSLEVVKNRRGQHRCKTNAATEQLICDLARVLPDGNIASVLNRLGLQTAKGHTWTQQRVRTFRNDHGLAVYREGERAERGELILHEAASRLGISKMTVVRLIKDGVLPAKQTCIGAPSARPQAASSRSCPKLLACLRMPIVARKPCSGCVFSRRMISISADVFGPISFARPWMRSGVQSA